MAEEDDLPDPFCSNCGAVWVGDDEDLCEDCYLGTEHPQENGPIHD